MKTLIPIIFLGFFSNSIFGQSVFDSFERFQKLQEEMMKEMDSAFMSDFGGGGVKNFEVAHREDDEFKYVDIITGEEGKNNLNIKIERGMISISGQIQNKNETERDGRVSTSTFFSSYNQSLSIPQGVVEEDASIQNGKDRITIKFPKFKKI